ncbi:MAG: efflux RND transporter periplasmic adaptor subunit [Flavobacteriales bacterium]
MKRFFRYLFIFLIAFLFIWTLYFLYKKSVQPPEVFNTEKPAIGNIVKKTIANGSIEPRQEVEVKPVVSGIIREVFVEAGDNVKKGDRIATIQIVPDMLSLNQAENRVRSAEIAQQNAQLNYDRNKPLAEKGVIAAAEMQTFDIALRNAKQESEAAQDALQLVRDGISKSSGGSSNTIVRSPVDGMVLDVPVKVGTSVIERNNFNEGTTIASVADMQDLIFKGKVDESEIGKVRLDMDLVLTIGAIDDETFPAKLEYIAPKGVDEEGAIKFEVRAAVKVPEGQFIRANYSANADIVLDRRDSVLTIPERLVQFNSTGDSAYVEVMTAPQQFEKRPIVTGLSDGINIEVISGLEKDTELKGKAMEEEEAVTPRSRRHG